VVTVAGRFELARKAASGIYLRGLGLIGPGDETVIRPEAFAADSREDFTARGMDMDLACQESSRRLIFGNHLRQLTFTVVGVTYG